jgi:hypothetical protein
MRVSSAAIKSQNAIATTPAEASASDALFAAILAGSGDAERGGGDADSSGAQGSSAGSGNHEAQPGGDHSQSSPDAPKTTSQPFDAASYLFVRAHASQVPSATASDADAAAPDLPAQVPSNAKREAKPAVPPAQAANVNVLMAVVVLPQSAQPIAPIGVLITQGKVNSNHTSDDSNTNAASSCENPAEPPQSATKNVNSSAPVQADIHPRNAFGTQDAGQFVDFSLGDAVQPGSTLQRAADDARNAPSDATQQQPVVPVVPPAAPSATPAVQTTSVLNLNPTSRITITTPPQTGGVTPGDFSLPVKPVERDSQTLKANTSTRSNAASDQTNNNSQDGSGTTVTTAPKAAANTVAAAPVQPAPQTPAAHDHSSAAGTATSTSHRAEIHSDGPASPEVASSTPAGGVNTARLMQSLQQTEMRVGMRSAEFGEISIRSSISQQQVIAQISAAHGELARAISDHLPSLQAKLDHYGVHASIEVSQGGTSFGSERDQASARDQKPRGTVVQGESAAPVTQHEHSAARSDYTPDDGRIDIRA